MIAILSVIPSVSDWLFCLGGGGLLQIKLRLNLGPERAIFFFFFFRDCGWVIMTPGPKWINIRFVAEMNNKQAGYPIKALHLGHTHLPISG